MPHEVLSRKIIRTYLDALVKSFGTRTAIPEKALSILFETRLFSECVREIKLKMHLPCGLKVYYHTDTTFPEPEAAAFISLPERMPYYGSKNFELMSIPLHVKKWLCSDYHAFVYCIAHEMSHIVLFCTHHSHRDSEIATDLFVMVCGFENVMQKGKKRIGYIDDYHFSYAKTYLDRLRKGKKGLTILQQIKWFLRSFKKRQSASFLFTPWCAYRSLSANLKLSNSRA